MLITCGMMLIVSATTATGAFLDGCPVSPADSGVLCLEYSRQDDINIDVVGNASMSSTGTGMAKGNSYQVDIDVVLLEAEFWLSFTSTQTLTYYVYVCPQEFGTYTEVHRHSETVTGSGAAWYSSGSLFVPMEAGYHYIILISWNGNTTYYYGSGDSQPTSFGYHTHGYAPGYDPMPESFQSLSNDQAIYYQRLTTSQGTPLSRHTWGAVKNLFD